MIALDTNVFIYVLEKNPDFGEAAYKFLKLAQGNGLSSTITYLELLSSSAFSNNEEARNLAMRFLNDQRLKYIELSREILLKGAQLRSASPSKIDLGDAVHLATAIHAGAEEFVTNDQNLVKLKIKGLKITSL